MRAYCIFYFCLYKFSLFFIHRVLTEVRPEPLCIISHKQKCRKYRRTPHRVSQGHLVRLVVRCLRCRCTCITRRNRSSCSYITPIKKCSATHLRNTLITHITYQKNITIQPYSYIYSFQNGLSVFLAGSI